MANELFLKPMGWMNSFPFGTAVSDSLSLDTSVWCQVWCQRGGEAGLRQAGARLQGRRSRTKTDRCKAAGEEKQD